MRPTTYADSRPVTSPPWRQRLHEAASDTDVLAVAREFVGALAARDVAMLPARLRPRPLLCAHDVSSYAFDLIGHYCEKGDPAARVIVQLAAFFTAASIRLSEIVTDANTREALRGHV
jgi:hypothetical protein